MMTKNNVAMAVRMVMKSNTLDTAYGWSEITSADDLRIEARIKANETLGKLTDEELDEFEKIMEN